MLTTPFFLGDPVLLASVFLVSNRPILDVIDNKPTPRPVFVHPDDATALLLWAPRLIVRRLQKVQCGANLLGSQSDLLSDCAGMNVGTSCFVSVR